MRNLALNKLLWFITVLVTLVTAAIGVSNPSIYRGLFAPQFLPGTLPQDILTVLICLFVLGLVTSMKAADIKKQIIVIGILGSFWYLYGIFVIERVYTLYYYLYLAVFSLTFWSMAYAVSSINKETIKTISLPKPINYASAAFSLGVGLLFTVIWTTSLFPLLLTHNRIDYLYSIYILDLCFVMPAYIVTAVMSLRKQPLGYFLLPAMLIVGFFVIFPLGLGELAKPYYGIATDTESMIMSFILSGLFIVFSVVHLKNLKTA